MMRALVTALSLCLLASPAFGEETRPMLTPVNVVGRGDGWVTLVYPAITLEGGDAEAIMLCLRAVRHAMYSAPAIHWVPVGVPKPLPSSDGLNRPNAIKRDLVISPGGFDPVSDMPYLTIRAENMTTGPLGVSFRVNVRVEP